ncbi:MAG: tripartite tricarboxylate transporter TctB family protein [Marinosulfonomonas sp.]|nr:tripartite tricarboxylate transporter TctB family protein [Marinosulfonomonas sp.]
MKTPNSKAGWLSGEGGKDILTAVGLLVFALCGFLFLNPESRSAFAGSDGMTWRTMPLIYASLLAGLGAIYLWQSIRKFQAERQQEQEPVPEQTRAEDRTIFFRRTTTIGMLLVYVALMGEFGFAMTTPIFMFLLFRLFKRGSWQGDALISFIGASLLWILFVRILHLNLEGDTWDPVTSFLLGSFRALGV